MRLDLSSVSAETLPTSGLLRTGEAMKNVFKTLKYRLFPGISAVNCSQSASVEISCVHRAKALPGIGSRRPPPQRSVLTPALLCQ